MIVCRIWHSHIKIAVAVAGFTSLRKLFSKNEFFRVHFWPSPWHPPEPYEHSRYQEYIFNNETRRRKEAFFWFPSARPFVSRGKKLRVFERAIFDQFWSSTALALRFLAVSRFLFFFAPARTFRRLRVDVNQK